jgi:hypothetical protein
MMSFFVQSYRENVPDDLSRPQQEDPIDPRLPRFYRKGAFLLF